MDQPPPPGSSDWIPVVEQVAAFLRSVPGTWVVSLPLGEADRAPTALTQRDGALALVARPEEFERPAVHRIASPEPDENTFDGDHVRGWEARRSDGVTEVVSFTRSTSARRAAEGWTVRLVLRIDG